jgi:hypothetical protein
MRTMNLAATILLAAIGTPVTLAVAQTQRPPRAENPSYSGAFETTPNSRLTGVDVVRTINTAEATYKYKHGSFADWDDLYSAIIAPAQNRAPGANGVAIGRGSEVVPGWILTLIVSHDGKAYQLSLRNRLDTKCPFSFFSDQSGLIYQGNVIGCESGT